MDSTKIAYQTKGNIATSDYYLVNISYNQPITRWWKVNLFLQGNYNHLRGTVNNAGFDLDKYDLQGNMTNLFTIRKDWTAEVSGYFHTGELEGTVKESAWGAINLGVSRPVLDKKGTLRLSVRDVANLLIYNNTTRYQNNDLFARYKPDTRVINLSFTYRFSKGKVAKIREHTGASEEEQGRVKSN